MMIIEQRVYTIRPGHVTEYIETYRRLGRQVQVQHLGRPMGYYFSEVGALNQIVHQWAYDSLADREARRALLEADPAWKAYLRARDEAGFLQSQENRILRSVTFVTDGQTNPQRAAPVASPPLAG